MIIMDPKVQIVTDLSPLACKRIMLTLERAGRVCYQSEQKGYPEKFLAGIVKRGHESVLEHCVISMEITTDRGVTHELVRHRLGAYSQESTRYVKYSEGGEYILPIEFVNDENQLNLWKSACEMSGSTYATMLSNGAKPENARSVLNNSLKTTIFTTYNIREWRHVLRLRCSPAAHPHIRQIGIAILLKFKEKFPCLFEDIPYDEKFYEEYKDHIDNIVSEDPIGE